MSEFVNTIELVGDDALIDSIIERTITEFRDDVVTSVGTYAFYGCAELTTIDLPNVESIGESAFEGCVNLTSLNIPNASLYNANKVFKNCSQLRSIEHAGAGHIYGQYAFSGCSALEKIILRGDTGQAMFEKCTSLKIVDIVVGNLGGYVFLTGATAVKALILRKTDAIHTFSNVGALNSSTIASGTGYIYVPSALIEDYKAATNWSTYADQFRALEDYTVDGTVTGELDETKI